MKENIIGREQEISKLENYISSRKSEFIAIYGRRRVGKTFLIKEMFEGRLPSELQAKTMSLPRNNSPILALPSLSK